MNIAQQQTFELEGQIWRELATSPDHTLKCLATNNHMMFVDAEYQKLYDTRTPGVITSGFFHTGKYEVLVWVNNTAKLVFDLATKEYIQPTKAHLRLFMTHGRQQRDVDA